MSAPATTDPNELRPALHARIDRCTPQELQAIHKLLLVLEAGNTFDEVGREMDSQWQRGEISDEKIAVALREHRAQNPYR